MYETIHNASDLVANSLRDSAHPMRSNEDMANDGREPVLHGHVRPHRGGRPGHPPIRYVDCGYEPESDVRGAASSSGSPTRLSQRDVGSAYGDQPQAV
jgi:hypothetical protein